MTGAEIVFKKGQEYYLFKVRHDGYFVEEYFKDQKNAFKYEFSKSMEEFIKSFMKTYGSPDAEVDTFFPQGFKTTITEPVDFLNEEDLAQITEKIEKKLEEECKKLKLDTDEEGLFCGYGDYCVFLDFDQKLVFGFYDNNSEPVILNEKLKPISFN